MVVLAGSYSLFFLIITFINKSNIKSGVANVARELKNRPGVDVVYSLKVTGEPTLIVVANATDAGIKSLEQSIDNSGPFQIICQPIISYESFARNLGVTNETLLAPPARDIVKKDDIYLLTFSVNYPGLTTNELLDIWRNEAVTVLTQRLAGSLSVVLYKHLAERKVQLIGNIPDPDSFDSASFQLPLSQGVKTGVSIQSKRLQYTDDYVR